MSVAIYHRRSARKGLDAELAPHSPTFIVLVVDECLVSAEVMEESVVILRRKDGCAQY